MNKHFIRTFVLCVFGLSLLSAAFAQDERDRERERRAVNAASSIYVISAKAGGVNFVSGKVAVARKDARSGYLIKGDELEIGDKVSTGADGKAEILLNPGSYIRLAENTEFEFVTTSLDDLKVKIKRGSAIFEVLADNEFRVAVVTPNADFYVIKSGVYRVDVLGESAARIEVWKGRAQVGDGQSAILKNGQSATISGDQTTVAKFDRDEKDVFEAWSKERAKELSKVNARLDRRDLRNSLLSNRRWNIFNSFGLWIFDASYGGSCFLPFGYGWASPYGYWFGRDLWDMNLPWWYYNPPIYNNPGNTGGTVSPVNSQNTSRNPRVDQPGQPNSSVNSQTIERTPRAVPPFMHIQREFGIDRGGTRNPATLDSPSFPSSTPSSAPPSAPMPPPSSNTDAKPGRGN